MLDARTTVLLLAPVCLILTGFFAWPLALGGWNSVFDPTTHVLTAKAYVSLSTSTLFYRVLSNTVQISVVATLVSLVLGYVIALHLARMDARKRAPYMMLVMLPFWTSILVKSFAFTVVLGGRGLVNQLLAGLGVGKVPLSIIWQTYAVAFGFAGFAANTATLSRTGALPAPLKRTHEMQVAHLLGFVKLVRVAKLSVEEHAGVEGMTADQRCESVHEGNVKTKR